MKLLKTASVALAAAILIGGSLFTGCNSSNTDQTSQDTEGKAPAPRKCSSPEEMGAMETPQKPEEPSKPEMGMMGSPQTPPKNPSGPENK